MSLSSASVFERPSNHRRPLRIRFAPSVLTRQRSESFVAGDKDFMNHACMLRIVRLHVDRELFRSFSGLSSGTFHATFLLLFFFVFSYDPRPSWRFMILRSGWSLQCTGVRSKIVAIRLAEALDCWPSARATGLFWWRSSGRFQNI